MSISTNSIDQARLASPIINWAEIPNEKLNAIKSELKMLCQKYPSDQGQPVAAFDADGTLWDIDVGESFFDYQIKYSALKSLPCDPWSHYREMKKISPTDAYMWLAQISEEHSLQQVRAWAQDSFNRLCGSNPGSLDLSAFPFFTSQREIVHFLQNDLNVEVYVVTASVKWAVEPAAASLGIDADHVLGITTEIVDGIVTAKPVYPVTWRQGKAEALLKATQGRYPIYCSGNTYGDIALLEASRGLVLAVSTQNPERQMKEHFRHGLYQEEVHLKEIAQQRGWWQHAFR